MLQKIVLAKELLERVTGVIGRQGKPLKFCEIKTAASLASRIALKDGAAGVIQRTR
jgi:hypothetical protein